MGDENHVSATAEPFIFSELAPRSYSTLPQNNPENNPASLTRTRSCVRLGDVTPRQQEREESFPRTLDSSFFSFSYCSLIRQNFS